MANKDDKSKTLLRRNPAHWEPGDASAPSSAQDLSQSPEDALIEAVDKERARLTKVESILDCTVAAMDYAALPTSGPYYPDAIAVACDLVRQTIDELDSVHLRPLVKRIKSEKEASARYGLPEEKTAPPGYEVKEPGVVYLV